MSEEVDESFVNFDFAIMAIFASYVFDIRTQVAVQRQKLKTSDFWRTGDKRFKGEKGVRKASLQAIVLALIVTIATAIAISLPSRELEPRMVYILEGLSLLFAAVVLGSLSFQVPIWTGVYYAVWEATTQETSRTLKEVEFNVRWGYYRIFTRYYFFLMPFYQGVNAITIPLSMLVGITVGLFADFAVYLARRKENLKRPIVISMIVVIVFGSCTLLGEGVYFIVKVWEKAENPKRDAWMLSSFLIGIFVESMLHIGRWWISRKKFTTEESGHGTSNRPRMAASMIFEAIEKKKAKEADQMTTLREEDESDENALLNSDANGNSGTPKEPEANANSQEKDEILQNVVDDDKEEYYDAYSQEDSQENGEICQHVDDEKDDYKSPSYKQMFCSYWTCCGCVRGNARTRSEQTWSFLSWTVWFVLVGFSLWLVIVNIGSTTQQVAAREKLPFVQNELYDFINEGPVCAFDDKGADSNITTFQDKDAAHAEGFLVLHCGACGACSDWHNLRLEYTTRTYLEAESARCARKSFTGGRNAVLECLKQPPIGFQGRCAECWVDDILCTREHCAFIFLQSTMIKGVSDMQVNADTITSAACEEAHCEAGNPGDFVNCSGATRRRMDVTSTIERPKSQRCLIVDVDWEVLFPE